MNTIKENANCIYCKHHTTSSLIDMKGTWRIKVLCICDCKKPEDEKKFKETFDAYGCGYFEEKE